MPNTLRTVREDAKPQSLAARTMRLRHGDLAALCHQLEEITGVTNGPSLVGVVSRRVFAMRTLEFEHNQRQPVNVQDRVGNPFLTAFDLQLMDDLVDVVVAGFVASLIVGWSFGNDVRRFC